jgi:hypothetical protein
VRIGSIAHILMLDLTAIMIGYNVPKDFARELAQQAVDEVEQRGTVIRRVKFKRQTSEVEDSREWQRRR